MQTETLTWYKLIRRGDESYEKRTGLPHEEEELLNLTGYNCMKLLETETFRQKPIETLKIE